MNSSTDNAIEGPPPGSENSNSEVQDPESTVPLPPPTPDPAPSDNSCQSCQSCLSPLSPSRSRTGKIARLPHAIRDQLNQRLDDGHEAKHLADWLNSLPEVRSILVAHFDAQPISESNLTRWKQGGFLDWQRLQQTRLDLAQFAEDADSLHSDAPALVLAEKLNSMLTAGFALAARDLLAAPSDPQDRWQRLRELLPELARLRHDNQRAQLLDLARRRSDRLEAQAQAVQDDATERKRITTVTQQQLISELLASPDPSLHAMAREMSETLFPGQPLHPLHPLHPASGVQPTPSATPPIAPTCA